MSFNIILVTDANIWIDLYAGETLDFVFLLPIVYYTTDFILNIGIKYIS